MQLEKPRVLFLIDYFHRTGGTERHLVHLATGLQAAGFHCSIVCFDLGANTLLDGLTRRGVQIVHLPVGREYTPSALLRARQLFGLIKSYNPDIVQTFHQKSDTYGALVAKVAGVPCLVSSKRDTGDLRKWRHFFLNRRLRGLFDKVIVVADAVGVAVMANDKVAPDSIVKIYNGVDTAVFAPARIPERLRARERLGFNADDFVVGMVAGFRPEKNHDTFFEGLSAARSRIPSLKALAVGGGPLLDHYRALCSTSATIPSTVFSGAVNDVLPYLHAMDVGCLIPGSNEGFSNAVLEQMAVGLPMIVSRVGGNAEAVNHNENGFVIRPRDPDGFARALMEMYEEGERRAYMGRRSRDIVDEQFSLERMCERHAQLYLSLCGRPQV